MIDNLNKLIEALNKIRQEYSGDIGVDIRIIDKVYRNSCDYELHSIDRLEVEKDGEEMSVVIYPLFFSIDGN